MQPFQTSDGKKFTNADSWRQHKASLGARGKSGTPQERGSGEVDGGEEQQAPEEVVAEHGPAVEVHIQHEHEMGSHHVHSVHPDGHEHHSDHGSAGEAHEHAKKLASADSEQEPSADEEEGIS